MTNTAPARTMAERLDVLLGHRFTNMAVAVEAMTHGSVSNGSRRSNERLEFLGDRVLGLVIATLLYHRFPVETEGDLARRLAALVRREALVQVAMDIGLADHIVMSPGEEEAGGRRNAALIADACEALIGAVYLDGGLEAAAVVVTRLWQPLVDGMAGPPKDAKTALQEWAQGRGLPLPVYREIGREGPPHAPVFSVEVTIAAGTGVAGCGPTKRIAEQSAAQCLLDRLAAGRNGAGSAGSPRR